MKNTSDMAHPTVAEMAVEIKVDSAVRQVNATNASKAEAMEVKTNRVLEVIMATKGMDMAGRVALANSTNLTTRTVPHMEPQQLHLPLLAPQQIPTPARTARNGKSTTKMAARIHTPNMVVMKLTCSGILKIINSNSRPDLLSKLIADTGRLVLMLLQARQAAQRMVRTVLHLRRQPSRLLHLHQERLLAVIMLSVPLFIKQNAPHR
jgi:hypothetical protein